MGFFSCLVGRRTRRLSAPVSAVPSSPNHGMSGSTDSGEGKQTSKSTGSSASQRSISEMYEETAQNLKVFELKELRNATNDFSRLLKIGEGGFGTVYKGLVRPVGGKGSSIAVAVKRLNQNGLQGHKQWLAEVQFLGVVEHPNLVKLIGYCSVDGEGGIQRLLVYEFMANRSLEDHLFNRAYPCLPWNTRLWIALGAAEGLAYLHEGLETQVIYRDFKASNILLDEDFKPKLSDFGLAREGPSEGKTHVSTAVMGTYGYAAPEYVETGHLTFKSDVWSFGTVLLEILTGRRTMERNRPRHEQKLLEWLKQSKHFSMIMDPRLKNQYSMKAAKEVAKLAYSCLCKNAKERPKMSEVVESLKHLMQFTDFADADELMEEFSVTESYAENKTDQASGTDFFRRRMHHLSRLSENASPVGMRRFMIMKAAALT